MHRNATRLLPLLLAALGGLATLGAAPLAVAQTSPTQKDDPSGTPHRTARPISLTARTLLNASPPANSHPLDHVLRWAKTVYPQIRDDIQDYSCLMVRRERVDGVLGDHQYIFAKVRHERHEDDRLIPFSLYLRVLDPAHLKGREVLYVRGENNDKMIARKGGRRFPYLIFELEPESELAMRGNRYPVTEFGIETLVRRLIEVAQEEVAADQCEVRFFRDAQIDNRTCTGIEVTQTVQREDSRFYRARIYIDNELQVPIHFETFGWPTDEDESPPLLEQYTYRNLKLNVGFTDEDFSRDNPQYQLRPAAKAPQVATDK